MSQTPIEQPAPPAVDISSEAGGGAMTDPRPVRLRLSRAKGFSLQALSRDINGLDAVNVARPSMFGNRWKIGVWSNTLGRNVETVEEAVDLFRCLAWSEPHMSAWVRERLAGKNLACWCTLPEPGKPDACHAAVLLEIANRPTCEAS